MCVCEWAREEEDDGGALLVSLVLAGRLPPVHLRGQSIVEVMAGHFRGFGGADRVAEVSEKYGARGVPGHKGPRVVNSVDQRMEQLAKLNKEASMSAVALKRVDVLLDASQREVVEVRLFRLRFNAPGQAWQTRRRAGSCCVVFPYTSLSH
jgi:hypothetical protein